MLTSTLNPACTVRDRLFGQKDGQTACLKVIGYGPQRQRTAAQGSTRPAAATEDSASPAAEARSPGHSQLPQTCVNLPLTSHIEIATASYEAPFVPLYLELSDSDVGLSMVSRPSLNLLGQVLALHPQ